MAAGVWGRMTSSAAADAAKADADAGTLWTVDVTGCTTWTHGVWFVLEHATFSVVMSVCEQSGGTWAVDARGGCTSADSTADVEVIKAIKGT